MLKLYNTLKRKKQPFKPLEDKKVGLYTCGPTVYWYAHIGNLRAYIFEDILRRVLEYNGYDVKHVMNITDVGHLTSDADSGEDKMIKALKREGKELNEKSMLEMADFYTKAFQKDLEKLNIQEPHVWCKATEHIKEQVELVKKIIDNGFAYETEKAVYFNTVKFKGYGELAKLDREGLREAARAPKRKDKKNPTDFALWLKLIGDHKNHIMNWDSPWGKGFPGWHVECSAMSLKHLGDRFDIHCGGIDHIPVHHTNERAQNIAALGHPAVNFWMHVDFLILKEGKMSKSEGNIITLNDIIEKGVDPLAYRYLGLNAHYRSKLVFGWEELEAAQNALRELKLIQTTLTKHKIKPKNKAEVEKFLSQKDEEFLKAVNDDLNTPKALSVLHQVLDYERELNENYRVNNEILNLFKESIKKWDRVLGLGLPKVQQEIIISETLKVTDKIKPLLKERSQELLKEKVPEKVKELVMKRDKYRQQEKWDKTDKIRKEVEELGYTIKDKPEGSQIKKKG